MKLDMLRMASAALLVAACRGGAPAAEPTHATESGTGPGMIMAQQMIPRSHTIPPGHVAEVRKLFEAGVFSVPISTVGSSGMQTQFVKPQPSFIGTQRFVVDLTPDMHTELDHMLDAMGKSPAPRPSSTYAVTFWAIQATSGAETQIAPELAELDPTLKGLTGLGKRKFTTIDRVSTRSLDGFKAFLRGRIFEVDQTLSVDPDGLQLAAKLVLHNPEAKDSQLETKVEVQLDKPVVLGDSALANGSDGAASLLLYVVRAQRVD